MTWFDGRGFWHNVIAGLFVSLLLTAFSFLYWWSWDRRRRDRKYLPLVLSDDPNHADDVEERARQFFSKRGPFPAIPRLNKPAQNRSSIQGETDVTSWIALKDVALKTFRGAEETRDRGRPEEIHLVFGTLVLWSFALGTLTRNWYRLVLYHHQNHNGGGSSYHRIWRIGRGAKDKRGVKPFRYDFLKETITEPLPQGKVTTECLVFEIGDKVIGQSVEAYREAHLPGARMRVYSKKRLLAYNTPGTWVQAAAEMAHAICDLDPKKSDARDTYLFMDAPAVLALMVGDAIGPFASRRLHLMQLDKNNQTYVEIICLPDPRW